MLAIGAPYGLEQTATSGIVSAKGRSLPGDAVVPFIQTDAAVNPGNSGGPLFDGSGSVVGINSQIYSRSGGFQGVSFAIPINVALKVKDQIVATGKAEHGRLGVTVQDLNQQLADSFGLTRVEGALVSSVAPNSAAAAAGLKSGDVITEVNGEPVERSGALSSLIGMAAPGEKVKLKVWRDHAERTIEAKLGGAAAEGKEVAERRMRLRDHGQLGLSLRPLTRDEKRESKLDAGPGRRRRRWRRGARRHRRRRRAPRHQRQAGAVDRAGEERDGRSSEERRAAGPARRREALRAGQGRLIRMFFRNAPGAARAPGALSWRSVRSTWRSGDTVN